MEAKRHSNNHINGMIDDIIYFIGRFTDLDIENKIHLSISQTKNQFTNHKHCLHGLNTQKLNLNAFIIFIG